VVSLFASTISVTQTPAQPPQPTDGAAVPIEVFQGPRPKFKDFRLPDYPGGEKLDRNEGWVQLCLMVDAGGQTYEPAIMRSSGNKVFDHEALKAVRSLTFEPASLNGKPVDSGYEIKFKYRLSPPADGARPEFVRNYNALMKATAANDKAAADAALSKLHVSNLYEDAYFGLATSSYAEHWGDDMQQLAGLQRAIAAEDSPRYLPKQIFPVALRALFRLQVRTHDYGGALITWEKLTRVGIDAETADNIKHVIDQLEVLRTDTREYAVPGKLENGTWYFHLFKSHFQVAVADGHVSEVRLRCDRRYVFFAFDPQVRYDVANGSGKCTLELVGEPGTTFSLIQS